MLFVTPDPKITYKSRTVPKGGFACGNTAKIVTESFETFLYS